MNTRGILLLVLLFFIVFVAAVGLSSDNYSHLTGGSDFPALHVNTTLPIVHREWTSAVVTLANTGEEFMFSGVNARVRGRGNTSWLMYKTPFNLRFDIARTMLDSGYAAHTWSLLANHNDRSLLRDYSAYYFSYLMNGMSSAAFSRFVDVYFNGEYQGVYLLSIQVAEVTEGRVNLVYNSNPALSEYLIQRCSNVPYDPRFVEGVDFVVVSGNPYRLHFPTRDNLTNAHLDYVIDFITRAENAMRNNYADVFDYVHLPSFVDYFIVKELYKNSDIHDSVFIQIRGHGEDRRLEMGPIWDFDTSAGNRAFVGRGHANTPEGIWLPYSMYWFNLLTVNHESFYYAVADRWREIRDIGIINRVINEIDYMSQKYQISFERNFDKWYVLGTIEISDVQYMNETFANPYLIEIDTFLGQVDYLIGFLTTRVAWLDSLLIHGNYSDMLDEINIREMQLRPEAIIVPTSDMYDIPPQPFGLPGRIAFIAEYLSGLAHENYTSIIVVSDESAMLFGDELEAAFDIIGLNESLRGMWRYSYGAIISGGDVIFESLGYESSDIVEYSTIIDNVPISIVSAGLDAKELSYSQILINGVEYGLGHRGMNIVIFDRALGRVVDSVSFDTHDDARFRRRVIDRD